MSFFGKKASIVQNEEFSVVRNTFEQFLFQPTWLGIARGAWIGSGILVLAPAGIILRRIILWLFASAEAHFSFSQALCWEIVFVTLSAACFAKTRLVARPFFNLQKQWYPLSKCRVCGIAVLGLPRISTMQKFVRCGTCGEINCVESLQIPENASCSKSRKFELERLQKSMHLTMIRWWRYVSNIALAGVLYVITFSLCFPLKHFAKIAKPHLAASIFDLIACVQIGGLIVAPLTIAISVILGQLVAIHFRNTKERFLELISQELSARESA